MNSLSWLIYIVSMLDTLRLFLIAGLTISVITVVVSAICRGIIADETPDSPMIPKAITLRNRMVFVSIFLAILVSVVPKKDTMVLIAASEIGERVLTSQTAQEIGNEVRSIVTPSTELLRTWIEDQTRQIRAAQPAPAANAGR